MALPAPGTRVVTPRPYTPPRTQPNYNSSMFGMFQILAGLTQIMMSQFQFGGGFGGGYQPGYNPFGGYGAPQPSPFNFYGPGPQTNYLL